MVNAVMSIIWMCILFRICYTDIRFRLIKNTDVLIVLGLVVCTLVIYDYPFNFPYALLTLAIGFVLVSVNVVGAGDIKLLAVLALSFSQGIFVGYLFAMSLLGIVLAIIEIVTVKVKKRKSRGLPYGVAIIGSYVFVLCDLLMPNVAQNGNLAGFGM